MAVSWQILKWLNKGKILSRSSSSPNYVTFSQKRLANISKRQERTWMQRFRHWICTTVIWRLSSMLNCLRLCARWIGMDQWIAWNCALSELEWTNELLEIVHSVNRNGSKVVEELCMKDDKVLGPETVCRERHPRMLWSWSMRRTNQSQVRNSNKYANVQFSYLQNGYKWSAKQCVLGMHVCQL